MLRKGLYVAATLLLSANGFAQGETEEEEGPWSGALSLGYLASSGNTETTNYNMNFEIGYVQNDWEHGFQALATGANENDITTAEAYQAGWRSAYNFTETDFIFGTVDWRKDRFAGVVEQTSVALNYGRRVIDTPNHMLALGLGAGYRDSDNADGSNDKGAIARGSLDYDWTITETAGFEQDLVVESGSGNTYIESISALRAAIVGELSLVLSYTIKHNTDVPPLTEETDTYTAISVEYAF